jgi:hypothetical protein
MVEAIANCGLEAALFYFVASTMDLHADTDRNGNPRTIPTYLAIYILALYRSPPYLSTNGEIVVSK